MRKIAFYINKREKQTGLGFLFPKRRLISYLEELLKTEFSFLKNIEEIWNSALGFVICIPYNSTEYLRGKYNYFTGPKGEIVSYMDEIKTPFIFACNIDYYKLISVISERKINVEINNNLCSLPKIIYIPFTLSDDVVVVNSSYDKKEKFLKKEILNYYFGFCEKLLNIIKITE